MHRFLAAAALASVLGGAICLALAATPPERVASSALVEVQSKPEVVAAKFGYVGVATCATGNCHGGPRRPLTWASAYTVWAQDDKRHAGAFQVLRTERSQQIAKLLGAERMLNKPAHESRLCLDCHSMQGRAGDQPLTTAQLSEGVGCESCHGAAEKWHPLHFRAGWKQKTSQEKAALGFVELKNLVSRTRSCTDCHIGSSTQDVNHDLIAAGHPRLSFEFGAFYQALPKHWNNQPDRSEPAFDARAWIVGQAQSMSAAARLLAARADKGTNKHAVWPEFAEFDCFACHHDLQNESWRRKQPAGDALGVPRWGTFYFPFSPLGAESQSLLGVDSQTAEQALAELSKTGRGVWRSGDPAAVRQATLAAAEQLDAWSVRLNDPNKYSAATVHKLLTRLLKDSDSLVQDWDGEFQLANGLTALCDAERKLNTEPGQQKKRAEALQGISAKLKFPDNYNSPARFTPEEFKAELEKLRSLLATP